MTRLSTFLHEVNLDFSQMTLLQARGWVIEMTIELEHRINEMIIKYFIPRNSEDFYNVVLNSSILHLGGKLKILRSLGIIDNKVLDKLRKLLAIRDAFAHANIYPNGKLVFNKESNESNMESIIDIVSVMGSDCEFKEKEAVQYLNDFRKLLNDICDLLNKSSSHGNR